MEPSARLGRRPAAAVRRCGLVRRAARQPAARRRCSSPPASRSGPPRPPRSRWRSCADRRGGAALAVAAVGLLGVVSALVFDPRATGCAECPRNLLLVAAMPVCTRLCSGRGSGWGSRRASGRSAPPAYGCCGPARPPAPAGSRDPRRRRVPRLAWRRSTCTAIPRGYLSADGVDRALWTLQGAALLVAAAWLASEPLRVRRARARLARLVVDLEARPEPRGCATSSPVCCAIPACDLSIRCPTGAAWTRAAGRSRPTPGRW